MHCLQIAIKEVDHLNEGEIFLLKDLFKGYEWNRLNIGERRSLGLLFLHEVKHGNLSTTIETTTKSSANQQLYIKKQSSIWS